MTPIDQRVDWEGIKQCLSVMHRESRVFLSRTLLIGGAASWFYRVQLQKAADPDFKESAASISSPQIWLSKDIDFTGIFRGDALEMMPGLVRSDAQGNRHLRINNIRIGFAQVGVTFDPVEAFSRARIGEFTLGDERVQFLVMDPITLYREKQALAIKRNQPNDHLHLAALKEFLALEFVRACEQLGEEEKPPLQQEQRWTSFLMDVQARALEITHDPRVLKRARTFLRGPGERAKFLREILDFNH